MQLFSSIHRFLRSLHIAGAILPAGKVGRGTFYFLSLGICILVLVVPVGMVYASPLKSVQQDGLSAIPSEFGEVIYRINPKSTKQLYIIGISHRDPQTGKNNSTTIQTQIEVYRLGEWLNKNLHLNLLLPEGYFGSGKNRSKRTSSDHALISSSSGYLKDAALQEKLETESFFVNAEMLLMEQPDFHASQVEDRNIYDAVRDSLDRLKESIDLSTDSSANMARLRYLQQVRTASLLQKIPEVIRKEVDNGYTGTYSALFTIGLSHLTTIHQYIEDHGIHLNPPENVQPFQDLSEASLGLLEEDYGVTIILPRTLADNTKLLKRINLDRIVPREKKVSAPL